MACKWLSVYIPCFSRYFIDCTTMDGTWEADGIGKSGFSNKHDADADVEDNVRASKSCDLQTLRFPPFSG